MKNYICIDGNKAELTEEQMRQLGIEPLKNNSFEVKSGELFYMLDVAGNVCSVPPGTYQTPTYTTADIVSVGNACKDKSIIEQRALHETLSRLLWRFAMQNGGEGERDIIIYHATKKCLIPRKYRTGLVRDLLTQTYSTVEVAQRAIDEIVNPFLSEHPDFVW